MPKLKRTLEDVAMGKSVYLHWGKGWVERKKKFLLARVIFQPFSSCASNDECCRRYVNNSTNGWNCPNQRGSQDS